ncbi:nucleotide exchange factor GrpE [Candidatus Nardonella dryophthoridicola]|uniref:nucleotide exchange factor GrpE n=1 Tax=Candidatus Nardonella dryophthoridicola TaxID=1971485 RepID=UPI001AD861DF|nr:nucleotide exchange factor GrpE [Candidatus Nardonella dryophthoridicola]QTJ62906.1 nucleotide exchange factor GrpE [Candidatus Nardonella dryophthoridicola]
MKNNIKNTINNINNKEKNNNLNKNIENNNKEKNKINENTKINNKKEDNNLDLKNIENNNKEKNEIEKNTKINNKEKIINFIKKKKQEILELKNNIESLNKEIINNKLYFRSEIENINKKKYIEIEKIRKFSNESIMLELIIVIDNLERTIKYNENQNNPTIEGIKLTLKLFIKIINKFGLFSIEETNIKFNPNIHQAVALEYNEKIEPDYVVEILQKGYILNERLIRPAMAKISTNKKD